MRKELRSEPLVLSDGEPIRRAARPGLAAFGLRLAALFEDRLPRLARDLDWPLLFADLFLLGMTPPRDSFRKIKYFTRGIPLAILHSLYMPGVFWRRPVLNCTGVRNGQSVA